MSPIQRTESFTQQYSAAVEKRGAGAHVHAGSPETVWLQDGRVGERVKEGREKMKFV